MSTEKTETKIEEEYRQFKEAVAANASMIKDGFNSAPPPSGLVLLINDIVTSKSTVWFLVGMGMEAAGITVGLLMGVGAYPIIDMVVGLGLGCALYWYQQRNQKPKEDGEGEC